MQTLKSVNTPFSPQAEIIELTRTLTQAIFRAPHLFPQGKSLRARLENLYPHKFNKTPDTENVFLKTPFLEHDGVITRQGSRNLLSSCVDFSQLAGLNPDSNGASVQELLPEQKHIRLPNEAPNIYYVWTMRRCCLAGGGVNYE
jgi:hypothetical protein